MIKNKIIHILLFISIIFVFGFAHQANAKKLFLEIYTSQACYRPSSEELFRRIKSISILQIVEFHVDSCDRLGWKDPFAKQQFMERQNRYNKEYFDIKNFSEQIIISGVDETLILNNVELAEKLEQAYDSLQKHKPDFEIDKIEGNKVFISLENLEFVDQEYTFYAIPYIENKITVMMSGENAGERIINTNIALDIFEMGTLVDFSENIVFALNNLNEKSDGIIIVLQETPLGFVVANKKYVF